MKKISYEENKKRFDALSTWDKHYAINVNTGEKVRFSRFSDGNVFLYAKGYRNKGWYYDEQNLLSNYIICALPDLDKQWHRRIKRAKAAILKSGFWKKDLEFLENLDKMTWDDKIELDKIYWSMRPGFPDIKDNKENWEKWNSTLAPYSEKYPFMFSYDENNNIQMNNRYIFERSDVRLKSMYFGKNSNKLVKEAIKDAYTRQVPYHYSAELGYDTSFEYDPDKGLAWFSEEYRGMGNGHYYVAIDENTAWFVEDD